MLILSLDLGKYHSMACILDSETRHTEFQTVSTDRRYLESLLKKHQPDLVVMERSLRRSDASGRDLQPSRGSEINVGVGRSLVGLLG